MTSVLKAPFGSIERKLLEKSPGEEKVFFYDELKYKLLEHLLYSSDSTLSAYNLLSISILFKKELQVTSTLRSQQSCSNPLSNLKQSVESVFHRMMKLFRS